VKEEANDRTHQCTRTQSASRLLTRRGGIGKSTRHHCWGGPTRLRGQPRRPGDRHEQARQTLENLALALEAVGATAQDVIKTTVYVVAGERADLSAVWVAVQESGIAGAASTLLGVSMLAIEGQLVEMEAIAVLE
jgi:enamine deaminase RidA (YjgF/YER057c/UK114 family)